MLSTAQHLQGFVLIANRLFFKHVDGGDVKESNRRTAELVGTFAYVALVMNVRVETLIEVVCSNVLVGRMRGNGANSTIQRSFQVQIDAAVCSDGRSLFL